MTSKATSQAEEIALDQPHDLLRTDHLRKDIKARSVSATFVTTAAQIVRFLLTLVSTVVLARLLSPQDFGLVALVTTVTGFLRAFKDAGLSTATIQRDHITHAQVSNLFWINVGLSGAMMLLVAALAPGIAWFFRDSRLTGITLTLSITFLMSGLTIQHQALLNRQMRFGAIALIEISAMIASLVVGIAMASTGCGYWSLVGSSLALEAVGLALTFPMARWRPQLPSRGSGIRPMLGFGANLTASNLIFTFARGMDNVLIGRFYGADAVGLYSRAMALLMRPLEQFLSPISSVFLPVLSRLQSEPERYRRAFLQINEAIALISFLGTGLMLPLARPITLVLLGYKWESVAAIFAGFTFAALYTPLSIVATWLFTSQGRGRDVLVSITVLSIVNILAFVAGLPYGPIGMAIAFSASGCLIRLPILYSMCGRSGPVTTRDLWGGFFRHLPLWFVVFAITWLSSAWTEHLSALAQLLICGPLGLLGGAVFIGLFAPQRRIAMNLFQALCAMRKNS